MATFTASELTSQPKEHVSGVISKTGNLTAVGVTGTASSVFKFVKIPNGATIVDFMWTGEDLAANQTYKLGVRLPISDTWTVTESALSSDLSFTGGQSHRGTNAKLPYKVSATNNAQLNYCWVEAVAAVAISASASHRLTVFYTMDDS